MNTKTRISSRERFMRLWNIRTAIQLSDGLMTQLRLIKMLREEKAAIRADVSRGKAVCA